MKTFKDITESKSTYTIYHNTMADAFLEATAYLKKNGYEFDEDDYFTQVSTGPRKPGDGQTNRYSIQINSIKTSRPKTLQVQIFNTGRKFELNMYGLR